MAAFAGEILTSDELTMQLDLPMPLVSATLMGLELKRMVAKRVDGRFEARA